MMPDAHTVLVVDDESEDLTMMCAAFEEQGFQCLESGNYDTAMSAFERYGDAIDLLVADISLPGSNGCELARAMLRVKPDLKVLFVSGHAGAEIGRFYGLSISDSHFLRKPFDAAVLVARVRSLMASSEPFHLAEPAGPLPAQENFHQ